MRNELLALLAAILVGTALSHAQSADAPEAVLGPPMPLKTDPALGTPIPTKPAMLPDPDPRLIDRTKRPPATPGAILSTPAMLPDPAPRAVNRDDRTAPLAETGTSKSGPAGAEASAPARPLPNGPASAPTAAPATTPTTAPMENWDIAPPRPTTSAWFSVDYLLWWMRGAPSGGPLVTVGGAGDPVPGALGQPNTRVALGDGPMRYGAFSGLRLRGSVPLDNDLSLEGGYLVLERRTAHFGTASDPAGSPVIARPVINAQTLLPSSYIDSFPGAVAGSTVVDARARLQGYELNLAANAFRDARTRVDLFAGFRMLDLNESLTVVDSLTAMTPTALTFNGSAVPTGSQISDFDGFHATNHFYGGQVGGRWTWQGEALSLSAVAKLAVGSTVQHATIAGESFLQMPGAAAPVSAVGGILAQPTNLGRHAHSVCSVVPEAGLEVGYQLTPRLRATLGYSLLYWTNVARPGDQTDRVVNPTPVPTDPGFGMGFGPARPALPLLRESDFWVQGLNLGLMLRF
jgi:hypothetical protein